MLILHYACWWFCDIWTILGNVYLTLRRTPDLFWILWYERVWLPLVRMYWITHYIEIVAVWVREVVCVLIAQDWSLKFTIWVSVFGCWFSKDHCSVPVLLLLFVSLIFLLLCCSAFVHLPAEEGHSKFTLVIWQLLHYRKSISCSNIVSREV